LPPRQVYPVDGPEQFAKQPALDPSSHFSIPINRPSPHIGLQVVGDVLFPPAH